MIFERKQRYRHSIFEIYRFLSYTNTGYDLALAEHYDNRFVLWHPHTLTGDRRIFKFPIRHRSMPGEGKRETLFPFSRPIKSTLFSLSFFSFRQIEPANSNEPPLKRSLFKTLKERKEKKKEERSESGESRWARDIEKLRLYVAQLAGKKVTKRERWMLVSLISAPSDHLGPLSRRATRWRGYRCQDDSKFHLLFSPRTASSCPRRGGKDAP